ncbi:hypothetical protein BU16DRAFT_167227 [Lophium mytilinum]|uniref:Uncharacterized protein n=1 Tax=Lophium mytilinum TaxID=390894 RepID=A0A6A6QE40_9PEZI|nr:hypothetical protein BU16DRAFT_167227 [Lophium mytilinum]
MHKSLNLNCIHTQRLRSQKLQLSYIKYTHLIHLSNTHSFPISSHLTTRPLYAALCNSNNTYPVLALPAHKCTHKPLNPGNAPIYAHIISPPPLPPQNADLRMILSRKASCPYAAMQCRLIVTFQFQT